MAPCRGSQEATGYAGVRFTLYAFPGKEPFYKKLGFKRMNTAMAIFENQVQALKQGLVTERGIPIQCKST
jgi:hypothetical protein